MLHIHYFIFVTTAQFYFLGKFTERFKYTAVNIFHVEKGVTMGILDKLKERLSGSDGGSGDTSEVTDYVELDTNAAAEKAKIVVRPFILDDFEQIKPILDVLREGHTISLINIKPLKDKDLIELKRAINKLKKTCDAVEGDIAGLLQFVYRSF